MANNISYKGFNSGALTFKSSGEFTKGRLVSFDSNGNCVMASTNSTFVGVCVAVRDGIITAQVEGYVEVPYSGSAPSYGWNRLTTGLNSAAKTSTDAEVPFYRVIKIDTANKIIGIIL